MVAGMTPIGFLGLSLFWLERANSYIIKRHSYNLIRLVPALMNFLQKDLQSWETEKFKNPKNVDFCLDP